MQIVPRFCNVSQFCAPKHTPFRAKKIILTARSLALPRPLLGGRDIPSPDPSHPTKPSGFDAASPKFHSYLRLYSRALRGSGANQNNQKKGACQTHRLSAARQHAAQTLQILFVQRRGIFDQVVQNIHNTFLGDRL